MSGVRVQGPCVSSVQHSSVITCTLCTKGKPKLVKKKLCNMFNKLKVSRKNYFHPGEEAHGGAEEDQGILGEATK